MCGFYCIVFIDYLLARKILLAYTNLFSPDNYKKNNKIVCKYFEDKYGRRSLEFKLRKKDETINYSLDEIKQWKIKKDM